MSLVTFIWAGAASAAMLLAIVHVMVWLFDRQRLASLALAFAALSLVGIACTEIGMMHSRSAEEWGRWVYWCHVPMYSLLVSILFFIRLYFGTGRLWLMWWIIATRTFILAANLASDPNFNFESIESIRQIAFLGEQVTVVASGVTSRWQWFPTFTMICYILFVLDATVALWRKGSRDARRTAAVVGGAMTLFMVLSTLSVHLVIWLKLQLPMIISAPYLMVVLAMGVELALDTLRAPALARSLLESESRLELAANAGQLGLWTLDLRLNKVQATERARRIGGVALEGDIDPQEFLQRICPEDIGLVRDAMANASANQSRFSAEFRVNIGGVLRWIAIQGTIEGDDSGEPVLIHGVARDITDQKRALAEAETLRREITHSGRVTMLGRLSSALAHELSQPLGAILRNAEAAEIMLKQPDPNLDELRAIVSDIHNDDQRAGAIIDRLRSLLKRRQMQFVPLSVESLITDASTLVRADAAARHVALQCLAAAPLPLISGDRVHLSQVLINLIINGIDSVCDSAGSSREVTVAAQVVDQSAVEISVADSGGGLAPEALARLFEPFFTTKPAGMGMGLSVSRTIVEAHGGRLCAENQNRGGALFRVILPVAPLPAA